MIQRMLLAPVLVATLALTAGGAPAQSLDAKNVSVSNVNISPTTLQANGGPVTVTFRVKRKKGVSIRSVSVIPKLNGKNGSAVPATPQGNDTYNATLTVGGNSTKKSIKATLTARVATNKGTNSVKLGTVTVEGQSNDPTQPPPPPPI